MQVCKVQWAPSAQPEDERERLDRTDGRSEGEGENHRQVKTIGEKEVKEKKISLITEILKIIFVFLPSLDNVAPKLEVTDCIFNMLTIVGNLALTIQAIVTDPASAPMNILSALVGGGEGPEGR